MATRPRRKTAARARRARRAPVGLSHEQIRRAALRLIDQDGIDAFSTRRLGSELGCEAMAIYWYYPNKEALLDAVVDELLSTIGVDAEVAAAGDWVAAMRGLAHAYRGLAQEHPRAFPLLATRRFATESTYAFLDQLFALARRQGLDDRTIASFYRAVGSYCSGIALSEIAGTSSTDLGPAALRARFPGVASVWPWLEPAHHDEMFSFGLEILLDALARSARQRPPEP
ncbi:MAG TPA: TetR family transcriptional regulator [Kofleriaceae bacterium]|nr:TetR family transcriptional regulator [Kofleriaceae bacterium]